MQLIIACCLVTYHSGVECFVADLQGMGRNVVNDAVTNVIYNLCPGCL